MNEQEAIIGFREQFRALVSKAVRESKDKPLDPETKRLHQEFGEHFRKIVRSEQTSEQTVKQ